MATHFPENPTYNSEIFTATPMPQMEKRTQAGHLKVTQEAGGGLCSQAAWLQRPRSEPPHDPF